jgi:hypothetical protein
MEEDTLKMEKIDWLSRFMTGKKKYSAAIIIPIVVAIINMLATAGFVSTETAEGLGSLATEFLPTLVALFGGIAYTVVEGINDNTRAKNSTVAVTAGQTVPSAPENTSQPALMQPQEVKTEISMPFDRESFMNMVEENVVKDFGVRNACTLYYEARRVLREYVRFNNNQALKDCWKFIGTLASNAFAEIWKQSYDNALIHLNDDSTCTYPNLEYKAIQEGMAHYAILQEYKEVQEIIETL